jgi:hypothetical protein
MTKLIEKGILEQLAVDPTKVSHLTPDELDQMMQRIAVVVESFTGTRPNWGLPSNAVKSTEQEQLDTLAALYLGAKPTPASLK